ncbi:PKD-like domain-containing protein [Flavobacterium sp. LB3P122]|uniref:PKD-like domain-containing protein n=1 Tax=Flavobacterium algoriphilum TaxID=3398738 RepID=UPI003A84C0B2
MKKKYFNFHINLYLVLIVSKSYHLFTIVLFTFLISIDSFAQTISSFTPTNACAGSAASVVITGTGFSGATSATFNGAIATYTVDSDTQITALLPAAATTGFITVKTSSGVTIVSSGTFTVTSTVTPSVLIAASPISPICSGTSVTFTASPANGGSTPTYQWYVGGIAVGTNSPTLTTNTLSNGNQIKVEMTSNATCPVPATVTSNIITMTVNNTVLPSVLISGNPLSPICVGTSVTFTAGVPNNGGLNPTYQWQINTIDVAGANGTTFTSSSLANGDIVRVKLTSNAACAAPNPVNSNEITMIVNPNATISLTSGNNNQTICISTAITNITYSINGGGTGATVSGLPTGVNGNYSGGVYTISGTPSVSGTFNYTVTTTGSCAQTSATGSIIVNPNATMSLTSANNNQAVCINNPIANITFSVGATGNNASVSGLPSGVSGSYSAGIFTISGTPTASGTFAYTITATGTCGNTTTNGTLTVNPAASITLASATGTDNQTVCVSTAITTITYSTSGGGTGATVSGLPTGVNGNYSGGVYTISGTPSISGTFNYTVTTTGTCAQTSIGGTIIVNPNATISLTSANNNQTVCINNAIANITFSVGATGNNASVSGLPSGVSGSYSAGVFTISGTPTASGTFAYMVTATGTCGNATTSGTLTVNPTASIVLTSAAGTNNQTKCISTAITNITYSINGGGTGATVSGLPTGVNGNYSGGVYTISGTPSVSGTFNYTVTTTGTCAQTSIGGTIIVSPNATISLTSANNNQTVCINNAIANITFNVGATGNNASVSGLPSGLSGSYSAGVFTISGTPTASSTFAYTVTATGTCANATASGTLTVNPAASITLTSAAGTNNQIKCISTAITNITYSIGGGGTGATVSGLPTGVNGSYSGGVYTISGTSSVSGTFNYTVTTTGTCAQTSIGGTIIVNPNATISLTSANNNQTVCINNVIANITFSIGATGNNASVSGLPSGVSGSYTTGVFTISGTPTANGTFAYTVTATGTCGTATGSGTLIINANSTIALSSAIGTDAQSDCINTAITNITYNIGGGGTGAIVSGLPGGVIGNYNSGTKIYTISGSPNVSGTFNYTVTTTGSCINPLLSGTIFVSPAIPATPLAPTSPQSTSVCPVVTGLQYNVTTVMNATGYIWSLPAGWNIISGTGTNSITVTASTSAVSGNITVKATNACGSSAASPSLAVTVGNFAFVDAGIDQTVCASAPAVSLSATVGGATGINNVNWTSSNGGAFFNAGKASTTYTPGASAIAAGTVTLTITTDDPSGSCVQASDQLTVTIRANPTAIISSISPICSGTSSTITFTATPNTTVTYKIGGGANQTITVDGTGIATLNTGALVSNTTYTLVSVAYTSAPGCSVNVSTSTTVNINTPVVTNANVDQTVCSSSPNVTLAGSISGGATTGTWSGGSGTFNPNNTTLNAVYTPSPAEITAGTVTLTLNSADPAGPCGATTDAMVVTINPSVVTNANTDQTVCASSPNVTLAGSILGGAATGTWSGGGGAFTPNITTLNAVYTPSAAEITVGTVTLTLTSADPTGPCGATTDAMVITINPLVVTNANADQTVCASSPNVTLAGSILGGAVTGTWSGGGGTFTPNITTLNAVYTPSAAEVTAGTVTLTLTSADPAGPCSATSDAMVITINPLVVTNANADQTVCANSSNVTLAGAITGGAITGTWSGGGGTFNPNNTNLNAVYTPNAAEITAGTVTLTLTSADPPGPCGAISDAMVITINPSVITNANADQTVCANSPNVTLAGSISGAAATGIWSGGGGTFNPNNTNLNPIYTPSAAEITAGTVTLTLTSADPPGPCGAISDAMVITINPLVVTSANVDQTVCASSPNVTLAGSILGGAVTGTWSGGGGTFTPNITTLNAVYTPSAAEVTAGTVTLTLTSADPPGPCGATSDAMVITINPLVVTNANADQTVCANSSNVTLAGAITGGAITGTWSGGGGSFNPNNTNLNAVYTPSAAEITAGTVTLTLTSADPPGPCGAISDAMVITINPLVITSANVDQTVCASSSNISLAGTITGGATTGTWSGGGGSFNPNNTTLNALYTPSAAEITAGTVTLTLTSADPAGPCGVISDAMVITINPAATVSAGSSQTICSNLSATMAGSFGGGAIAAIWSTSGTGSFNNNTTTAIYTPSSADISAGSVILTYTTNDPAGPCGSINASLVLTIKKAVSINTQPSNVGICASSPAQLGVVASGDGLIYQWYKGTFPGTAVTNTVFITGAQTSILNFSQAFLPDDGIYYVVVGGASPCSSVKSNEVTLNVDQSILITNQPVAQTVCEATSNISFSVTANAGGDPITYQWRKNGTNISGATTPTYTLSTAVLGSAGNYDVVVSGPSGYTCPTVTSVSVALTVTPTVGIPTAINISAGTEPSCQITTSTTTYVTTATNTTGFNWSLSNPAAGTINSSGVMTWATGFSGSVNIQVTANGCNGPSLLVIRTVVVTATPNAVATNSAQTICSATAITTMVLSGNVASTTFNWTRNNSGTVTGIAASGSGDISGSLTNTTNAPLTVTFTITPTANGCGGTPITTTVLVNPTPNVVVTNSAQTICSGSAITAMVLSGNVASTTYNWTRDNTVALTGIAASGSTNISGSLTNTTSAPVTVTFTITPIANGCSGMPITATVLVNPTPVTVATNSAQTICSTNAIATMVLSGNVTSTTFNWTRNNTGTVTGITNNGTGDISGSLTNTTSAPITVTFTITPIANGCSGIPITATVLVNPKPNSVATNSAQTICSGTAITTMVLSGNITSTTFNWTRNNTSTVTGITNSGTVDISGILTNITSAPVNVTFTITPTANGCPGLPIIATVLVNPAPNAVATPVSQTICSASPITTIVLSGSNASTTYNWTRDNTVAVTGIASSGSGNISGTLTNTTNAQITVTFMITPIVNGCNGIPINATIIIEAASVGGAVTISQPSILPVVKIVTVCHSASGTIYLSGHTGTVVRWESSTTGGASWTPIVNTGIKYDYTNILVTTLFRAVIQNGSLCALAYSATSIINVIPNIKPSPVSATPSTICNGDSTILSSQSGYATSQILASGGAFDTANPKNWLVDGCGNCLSAGGSNTNPGPFQESATNGGTYSGINYTSSGKFVIANGNFNSILQTPVFNTLGLTSASLHFDHAYNLLAGASAKVEISIDGGTTYNTILAQYNGPSTQLPYNISTNMSIDLSAYLGQTNLKIRFNYQGTVGSSWAIDNIEIPEAPVGVLTSQWVDTNTNTVISNTNSTNATVSPTVTTIYAVTSYLNGCTSLGINGTTYVTVTVNQRPVVTAPPGIICSDDTTNIPLTSSELGTTFAWTVVQTGVSGASPGTLNTIAQKLTTTSATSGTAVYTITPTSKGCAGTAKTVTIAVHPAPTGNIGPSQTICYDGTATFSIALTGTAPWSITYSNGTTLTTVNNASANPFVFTVSNIISNKTYTITALSDSQCNAKPTDLTGSATVSVLTGTAGLWTGLVSTDWFDCKNWAGGLPSSTINAQIPTIPSGGPRMPVINPANSVFAAAYSNIASAQDLIIDSGASVTMAPIGVSDLQISRDWKNSGSFIPGTGTVTFNGGTSNQVQTVNLGIKTNENFYNLTTNNSGTAKGINLVDDFELTVSNTLSLLSGDLRLTGEAQLVQAGTGANPSSGSGRLLRDQQGQKNSFNYNYWCSPVSTNNTNYSISGVLRDGTDVTTNPFSPGSITFGDSAYFADGAATNPIKISNRWLFCYSSLTLDSNTGLQNYSQWNYIGSTGVVKIGEGFTMKGTDGTASSLFLQNYVFVGKPNSGTIPLNIVTDQTYLIGNPYPSALDADEFIKDNLKDCSGCRGSANIFSGALYFWDHFGLTSNHFLAQYVGGYATYTLMGGLVAIANDPLNINNGSTGVKTPKRYIPVAQGFFVDASLAPSLAGTVATVQGGILNFKNSQRGFIRENSGNSMFMKESLSKKQHVVSNDQRPKIRLSLASSKGINRQLLVGVDSNTTNQFDIGYDAPMLDIEGDNIYWEISNSKFIIQAIPDFNLERIIPIGLTIVNEGIATIKIDAVENIPETTKIYLHDNVSGSYHDIKNSKFTIALAVGEYKNRFSLQFTNKTLAVEENNIDDGIQVLYSNNYKVLIIQNKILDTIIKEVHLFNLLGQHLVKWDVENKDQTRIQIPIKNLSSGVYIVKLTTSKGGYNKKIIIK